MGQEYLKCSVKKPEFWWNVTTSVSGLLKWARHQTPQFL